MTSPFVPGARVAIVGVFGRYEPDIVRSVLSNGNFTICARKRDQWRAEPSIGKAGRWEAWGRGQASGERLILWDASVGAELADRQAKAERKERVQTLCAHVAKATDSQLSAIEAILSPGEG